MNEPVSWVIGRGGLLGRSVESSLALRGTVWYPSEAFAWDEPGLLAAQFSRTCHVFSEAVGDSPWQVAWCAGAAVVSSEHWKLQRETDALSHFLSSIAGALSPRRMAAGSFFLVSSAGGVYAGSSGAPYSESSPVRPLSAYGETKLLQESLARAWSRQTGTPTLIGRISNLYGPDQDLSKNQGLITQVCARAIIRQPLILYVPLDTIRDYLFARDAAALIADGLERLRVTVAASCDTPVVMKILASHQPTTVATVLGQVRRVTKRPVSVVVARTPHARPQPPDLRMASTVWSELDRRPLTTLSAGIQAVVTDLVCRAGRGVLVAGHAPNRSAGLGSGTAINGQHCSQDDRAR